MIEYINYKNKKYPVRVGYYALKHTSAFLKTKGKPDLDIEDIFSGDIEVYEPLLFFSLQMGAKASDSILELTMEDMEDVLDYCLFEFAEIVPKFFPNNKEAGIEKKLNQGLKMK